MEVTLTPEQQSFVQQAMDSGRLTSPEAALAEALALWEERERRRLSIIAAVETAQASLAAGKGRTVGTPEQNQSLVQDIKQRGLQRLAIEQGRR